MTTEVKARNPYRSIRINGEIKKYSHYVWYLNTGEWPKHPKVIHHKDGDPSNDDFDNLLLMTIAENSLYRKKSQYRGKSASYKQVMVAGKKRLYSHYIWHQHTGHWPEHPELIHHKDGNSLNDAFENLELMTLSEHTSLEMFGERMGKNNPNWHGDDASANAKYCRHYRHPNLYPPLTEAEREERNAYNRERYKKKGFKEADE